MLSQDSHCHCSCLILLQRTEFLSAALYCHVCPTEGGNSPSLQLEWRVVHVYVLYENTHVGRNVGTLCLLCVCVCWETKLPNERWTRSHLTLSESLTAALKYCPDSHRRGEKRKSSPTETCALTWFNRRSSTSSKPELIPGLLMMQPPLRTDTGKLTWEAGRWVSVWPNTFLPSH